MSDEFEYRHATEAEAPRVLKLMVDVFQRDRDERWFRWFNVDCPRGPNRLTVAVHRETGRFAGGYGLLPMKLKVGDRVLDASLCQNVMTHPDFQRRGIFTNLGRAALGLDGRSGVQMSVGIPNANAYRGHMKVGWAAPAELHFIALESFEQHDPDTREVASFPADVDPVLSWVAEQCTLCVLKDHRVLNWRLVDHPKVDYKLFVTPSSGPADGYMALKRFVDGERTKTHIVELGARGDQAFDHLVARAVTEAVGTDELNLWEVDGSLYASSFARWGFARQDRADPLILYPHGEGVALPEGGHWWLTLADNDVY